MEFRDPTLAERRLILELAKLASLHDPECWLSTLKVREMSDGGMGSLEFASGCGNAQSGLVVPKASVRFIDEDGVDVIVTLNAGKDGLPFEMDVWKTDFSPLKKIPDVFLNLQEKNSV